jgi:hypothetical protein
MDTVVVPRTVSPGTYGVDLAVLAEDGRSAHVDLAIEGKRTDRWYEVSTLTIR